MTVTFCSEAAASDPSSVLSSLKEFGVMSSTGSMGRVTRYCAAETSPPHVKRCHNHRDLPLEFDAPNIQNKYQKHGIR